MRDLAATINSQILPYGLVVRIPAFHAGGPGSIPGVGGFNDFTLNTNLSGSQIAMQL